MAFASKSEFDMQGHRGARGLFPENTLRAFEAAVENGMTTIELDVHFTKDGAFIVFHDNQLNEQNCKIGSNTILESMWVHELTVSQLKTIDVGSVSNLKFEKQIKLPPTPPLTLQELFISVSQKATGDPRYGKIRFNIELKIADSALPETDLKKVAEKLLKTIKDFELGSRSTIQSFHIPFIKTVKTIDPSILTSALFSPTQSQGLQMKLGLSANQMDILQETLEASADTISPHYLYCSKAFVITCHSHGLKVIPWTVNEVEQMIKLLVNGVDGIISDYPDLLQSTYQKWKETS